MDQRPTIRPVGPSDRASIATHFDRHRRESGNGQPHFVPYEADDPDAPSGFDPVALARGLDEPGWQRWFAAFVADGSRAVGHVDLAGPALRSALHRCVLGIGVEEGYRGAGLGRQLMTRAIAFACDTPSIDWIDLRVFAHNGPARRLYRSLGFEPVGTCRDCFRIGADSVDDIAMTLNVAN